MKAVKRLVFKTRDWEKYWETQVHADEHCLLQLHVFHRFTFQLTPNDVTH